MRLYHVISFEKGLTAVLDRRLKLEQKIRIKIRVLDRLELDAEMRERNE